MFNIKKFLIGLKIVPKSSTGANSLGELEVLSSTNKLNFHNGTSVSPVVTESHSATLTNKTIDADSNTITNIDNADIKALAAIDASKIADGSVSSTEFQYINSLTSNAQTQISAAQSTADNHISNATGAHAASAISNTPSGNLAAIQVQAALNELQTDVDTRATSAALSAHISNTTGAHAASAISSTPSGNLAAIEVQAALNELQTDVDTRATSTALTTHTGASTGVHGVTGSVVGTSDSQTLTNKTITGADIRTPVRSDVKQNTKANLTTYALTASNGQLCFATDTKEMFQVVDTLLESVGGGAGIGGVDILFSQTFEEAALTDFTQTGLSLSTSSPLHGAISALMTHQPATSQSFKQVIAVDEKFRSLAMLLSLNIKSTATAGNVTISVYDETSAPPAILASTQLQVSSATAGTKDSVSFTIPATCLSMSYTITALQEAGSPVTRIDDIICQLANSSLLETSVTVPNITAWQGYTPTFTGFGTATNIEFEWRQVGENAEIRGKFTAGTCTAVEARVSLPNGFTSAGTGLIPSIQSVGTTAAFTSVGIAVRTALIEPSVTYITFGDQLVSRAGLTKLLGNEFQSTGVTVSFTASVPCAGLSATSDVAIPLTQSGLVQEADSTLRMSSASKSGDVILFANVEESIGTAVSYSAGQFTVSVDGIYNIGTMVTMAGTDNKVLITKNSTSNSITAASTLSWGSTHNTGGYEAKAFWSGPLVSGDVIRFISTATLSVSNASQKMFISYQGSLKQVNINTNSKITIPTSELRFEGASARGAVATAIVKFDTMAKIRGDAFTVTNTANDGTFITMTKAGKLDVSANVYKSAAAQTMAITKNQAVLTTTPANNAEIIATTGTAATSSNFQGVAASVFVQVGDVIRVYSNATPSAAYENTFNLVFQEQDIQVSVSNTLPQFSESDSSVRLDTANGYGSTNTTTRRFSNVIQNLGTDIQYVDSVTLGGQFTAMSSGIYNVSYCEISSANTTALRASIAVNGVVVNQDGNIYNTASTSQKNASPSWSGFLSSGDIITAIIPVPAEANGIGSYFTMSKVGKPNVTGVDVTPFVNVPQPVSQSIYRDFARASGGGATFAGNLTSDSGSSLLSYNSTSGVFTALKKVRITSSLSIRTNAAATVIANISRNANSVGVSSSIAVATNWANASWSGLLEIGDTLLFTNAGAGAVNYDISSITATALSDQILTAPETFSTDTAALTYAGSGTYTLATLANAPVGTFITYTYAINSNTRTQTTTAPTQTTADMNTNGMLIYTRAYNAASTAALPAAIAIQLGKGLKGKSLDLYKSAGKVTAGSLDYWQPASATAYGTMFKDYNEITGILYIDLGFNDQVTSTRLLYFSDLSAQASGYLVVNASKNPALTGLGLGTVAARGVNTAGTSFNATPSVLVYDAVTSFDTNGALNNATGVFTAPETGYYQVDAGIDFVSAAYTGGQAVDIRGYKNGVFYSYGGIYKPGTTSLTVRLTYNDKVFLGKGDNFSIFVTNSRGATALSTATTANFFSIAKVGV